MIRRRLHLSKKRNVLLKIQLRSVVYLWQTFQELVTLEIQALSCIHDWLLFGWVFFLNDAIEFYRLFNPKRNLHSLQLNSYTSISRDPMHTQDQIQSACRTPQTVSHLNLSVYMEAGFDQVSSKQLNNSVQWQSYFTWLVHLSWLWI